jgi:predicted O-methyltransferase YrrM
MRDEALYPNWFAMYAQGYFERNLADLAGKPGLRFLQIGAYTGDATAWLFEHVLTAPNSTLTDVDTWQGSAEDLHEPMDFVEVERIYDERTASLQQAKRLAKFKGTSQAYLRQAPQLAFDFIYIDGAHTSYAVLNDAVHAYPCLRSGGLLAFDDYKWHSGHGRLAEPAVAIDAIADVYADRLTRRDGPPDELQVWFVKIGGADEEAYHGRSEVNGRWGAWRRGYARPKRSIR